MAIHVIGGELRGRTLFGGRGRAVRPTLAQVREALFNILGARVPGTAVLDMFAGSGALAIEALSRGAVRATLLERDATAHRVILRNLQELGIADRADLHRVDARTWMKRTSLRQYELIFLDPPWDGPEGGEVLRYLAEEAELSPDVWISWEYAARSGAPTKLGSLEAAVERRYGDTGLTIYRRVAG